MADYMPASIQIGGTLDRAHLAGLCRAAADDGAGIDWGDDSVDPDAVEELAAAGTNTLDLMNDEARFGLLDELEAFCQAHALTYRVESDAKYEHDGQVTYWRPGDAGPRSFDATQDGEVHISVSSLVHSLRNGDTLAEVVARYDLPPVPPFQLTGATPTEVCDSAVLSREP